MIVTNEGIIIRIGTKQVSTMSRVTQGVRLINLKEEQHVSSAAIIDNTEETTEKVEDESELIFFCLKLILIIKSYVSRGT